MPSPQTNDVVAAPAKTAPISAIVLAYNQETIAGASAWSILNQTIVPAEVILSDDHSSDGTYAVFEEVQRTYKGPAKVRVQRNPRNLGLCLHLNAAVAQASHEWVLPQAGDDVSEPRRVERLLEEREKHPDVLFFWSAVWPMSWDGRKGKDLHPDIPLSLGHACMRAAGKGNVPIPGIPGDNQNDLRFVPWGVGPSQFWSKKLFSCFGALPDDTAAEDSVLPFRARCIGKISYIPEPLVGWRERDPALPPADKLRITYRDHVLRLTAAKCQLADLALLIRKNPDSSPEWRQLHKELQEAVKAEKRKFDLDFRLALASQGTWTERMVFAMVILMTYGPIRTFRNFLLAHVLLAPASLEERIGGHGAARAIAAICAFAAAGVTLALLRNHGIVPASLGGIGTAICVYPAAILALRTGIRLSSTDPHP